MRAFIWIFSVLYFMGQFTRSLSTGEANARRNDSWLDVRFAPSSQSPRLKSSFDEDLLLDELIPASLDRRSQTETLLDDLEGSGLAEQSGTAVNKLSFETIQTTTAFPSSTSYTSQVTAQRLPIVTPSKKPVTAVPKILIDGEIPNVTKPPVKSQPDKQKPPIIVYPDQVFFGNFNNMVAVDYDLSSRISTADFFPEIFSTTCSEFVMNPIQHHQTLVLVCGDGYSEVPFGIRVHEMDCQDNVKSIGPVLFHITTKAQVGKIKAFKVGEKTYFIALLKNARSQLYELIFEESLVKIQWVQDIPHEHLTDVSVVQLYDKYDEIYVAFSSFSPTCDGGINRCSGASPLYRFEEGSLWFCTYADQQRAISVTGWEMRGRLQLIFAGFVDGNSDASNLFFYELSDQDDCRLHLKSVIRKIRGKQLYGVQSVYYFQRRRYPHLAVGVTTTRKTGVTSSFILTTNRVGTFISDSAVSFSGRPQFTGFNLVKTSCVSLVLGYGTLSPTQLFHVFYDNGKMRISRLHMQDFPGNLLESSVGQCGNHDLIVFSRADARDLPMVGLYCDAIEDSYEPSYDRPRKPKYISKFDVSATLPPVYRVQQTQLNISGSAPGESQRHFPKQQNRDEVRGPVLNMAPVPSMTIQPIVSQYSHANPAAIYSASNFVTTNIQMPPLPQLPPQTIMNQHPVGAQINPYNSAASQYISESRSFPEAPLQPSRPPPFRGIHYMNSSILNDAHNDIPAVKIQNTRSINQPRIEDELYRSFISMAPQANPAYTENQNPRQILVPETVFPVSPEANMLPPFLNSMQQFVPGGLENEPSTTQTTPGAAVAYAHSSNSRQTISPPSLQQTHTHVYSTTFQPSEPTIPSGWIKVPIKKKPESLRDYHLKNKNQTKVL